jgi:hypothetical protein
LHVTVVTPIENWLPDSGAHATDTGDDPPDVVGGAYVTSCVPVVRPSRVMGLAQEICGAAGEGAGVGAVGPPQAWRHTETRANAAIAGRRISVVYSGEP